MVGLSMGGGTVQTFALAHPERVRALGLISTSSEFPTATRQRFYDNADIAEREGMGPQGERLVASWFAPAFRERDAAEFDLNVRATLANDPKAFAASARANAVRDWTDQLDRITCPTLFVGGELDPAEVVETQETLRDMVRLLDRLLRPDGYNVGLNLGRAAGAGLPGHLHWHVVPRWNGDTNFMPVLADVKVIVQSLDALWEVLTTQLGERGA